MFDELPTCVRFQRCLFQYWANKSLSMNSACLSHFCYVSCTRSTQAWKFSPSVEWTTLHFWVINNLTSSLDTVSLDWHFIHGASQGIVFNLRMGMFADQSLWLSAASNLGVKVLRVLMTVNKDFCVRLLRNTVLACVGIRRFPTSLKRLLHVLC